MIGSAVDDISHIGVTTAMLEQLPERAALAVAQVLDLGGGTTKVRSFSDEQVRAAVIVALELLMTSSCPRVRRATKKFHSKIASAALRQDHATDAARAGEQAPPPPADSLDDRAVFWRGPQGADGTYEVRLADGRASVWLARAKDMGGTIAVSGRQRSKACVIATAVRQRRPATDSKSHRRRCWQHSRKELSSLRSSSGRFRRQRGAQSGASERGEDQGDGAQRTLRPLEAVGLPTPFPLARWGRRCRPPPPAF